MRSVLGCAAMVSRTILGLCMVMAVVPVWGQGTSGYEVGVGDSITVDAYQHSEVSGTFLVEENGSIVYPFLGNVPVAGMSTQEIARLLEQLLEKDYYVDVQLQVDVKEYRSKPVTILGEVGKPGTYYLKGKSTLTMVLADAGGLRASAGPLLELRRMEVEDGKTVQKVYTFLTEDLRRGDSETDVEIREGDILSVSAKQLYFITGEISRPGRYEISVGMTLMQAVSQAGGVAKFASNDVELHREVDGKKTILTYDLSRIRKGKDEDPPIESNDVIIVRRRFF